MPKKNKVKIEDEIQDALQRSKGYSELFVSVSRGNYCGLRAMIHSGKDLNSPQSTSGKTIIYAVIRSNNAQMVMKLIRAGGNPNVVPEKLTTPLGYAVLLGYLDVVKALVENGANIHQTYDLGNQRQGTVLHDSASVGLMKMCEFLIERGVDVNACSEDGTTALHLAIAAGKTRVVELLIAKGADISATCNFFKETAQCEFGSNITPIFLAAFFRHLDIIRILMKAGADLNVKTNQNFTVLHIAARCGSLELVNIFLDAGAGVYINVQATTGWTPLFYAVRSGHLDFVEALLKVEGIDVNVKCKLGGTPLIGAVARGHLEVVKLLIANFAAVDGEVLSGTTLLHLALSYKQDNVAEYLIEHGADIHALNRDNETSLHWACIRGNSVEIITTLVAKGGNVNAKTSNGRTPLDLAAARGYLEIVKFLIDAGADANSRDANNWTCLHYAADSGDVPTVQFLMTKVSEIDAMTLSLTTPLQCAIYRGHRHVVEILLKNGANINAQDDIKCAALHIAVENEQQEIAELLLKRNARINLTNEQGCTPLFLAVLNNHEKLVNLLLDAGANVTIPNKFGVWPIHLAADAENVSVVEALLAKGAHYDIKAEAKNFSGTPLEFAQKVDNAKIIILLEIIRKLFSAVRKNKTSRIILCIEAGAIVNARNANGRTALHFAVSNNNIKAVKALLEGGADMGLASNRGFLPLHIAVEKDYTKITEILLENARSLSFLKRKAVVNAEVGTGMPLHTATKNNNFHIVKLLLENGAIYNCKDKYGKTPLDFTATSEKIQSLLVSVAKLFAAVRKENGLEEVLEILEQNSSALNAREADNGRTPLYWSILSGHTNIACALLSKSADHCLVTKKGETPLHAAASKGNVEIVKLLINHAKKDDVVKANDFINSATIDGTTALHVASIDVVSCLLQAGAMYNIGNKNGKTALELTQNDDVKKMLRTVHQIFEAVENGTFAVMDSSIGLGGQKRKAIMSMRNAQGQSLVQVALAKGHVEIAKKLLKLLK